jgi:periplasmic divalent cation tolerance protein
MIIVLTTYPGKKSAETAASGIVKQGLAACVNVMKIESSHYIWKGKAVKAQEFLLVIKTAEKRYKKLEAWIKKNHPYELPEIIKVPVTGGLKAYLDWTGS